MPLFFVSCYNRLMPSSSYERLTIRALRELLPGVTWIERQRPNFLKYTTGNNLELDLWDQQHAVAIEVQGPQHYRSVKEMATAEQSAAQQARDTFKKQRCQELEIELVMADIATLSQWPRFYQFYLFVGRMVGVQRLLLWSEFQRNRVVGQVYLEASELARQNRPAKQASKPKRLPGFGNLLRRTFHMGGYR